MKAIIVDDERLGIRQFQMEAEGIEGVEIAGAFLILWKLWILPGTIRYRLLFWILKCL